MDLALSSSTVLGAAVLVWLLWVAPYLTRRRRAERIAGETSLLMDADPLAAPSGAQAARAEMSAGEASVGGRAMPEGPQPPAATGPPSSASPASREAEVRRPGAAPLRIRWGRMGVALTGLIALLGAAVTLGLTFVGFPGWVPAACAAAAVGSIATLRTLAVRDRKHRVEDAFRAAIVANEAEPETPARSHGPSEVFDAGTEPAPPPRPVSREELRALALEVAKASQASAAEAAKAHGETEEWEPVDVPRPSYVDAAKAERPEPAPLERPADPKPEGRPSLKPKPGAPGAGEVPGVPALPPRPAGRTGALGNLDEVLQRRRA